MAIVRNKLELQRDKRKPRIKVSRRALLRAALKRLTTNNTLRDKQNRYNKSHRSPEHQNAYEARIIRITARRFKLEPGQQFPLRAIILMADKGVRQAIDQYNKLYQVALANDISIHKAYDQFVLGR